MTVTEDSAPSFDHPIIVYLLLRLKTGAPIRCDKSRLYMKKPPGIRQSLALELAFDTGSSYNIPQHRKVAQNDLREESAAINGHC